MSAVEVVTDSPVGVLGSTEPRLWTPPLRELTPETSFGFEVCDFARDVLGWPFDPWQEWLVIHGGELLPDGRPRFRKVLVLVARQNGKTHVLVVLTLWWQFVVGVPLVLGTSTKVDYAKESWAKSVQIAEAAESLTALRGPRRWTRDANGEQESWTTAGCRYKIAASNRFGGRSLTIHRLILDELREHHDYSSWAASVPAGNAVRDFQMWALSNAGTDDSVVLNDLRGDALRWMDDGVGDPRLGLFEWSCAEDADPLDGVELAQANPNLGRRIDADVLLGDAARAVAKGGQALATFKTENMCVNIRVFDPAVDPGAWLRCSDPSEDRGARSRTAMCLDVSPDGRHATLVAAWILDDGRARVRVVRAWEDTDVLRRELPKLLVRLKPRTLGWFPDGPAAALAADLAERKGRTGWPPPGVTVDEIRGETAAACMGLVEQVTGARIAHSNDPLLNAHIGGAERFKRGDRYVFSRRGDGHCDAAYATAGAVHLARTLPAPVGKPRLIVAT